MISALGTDWWKFLEISVSLHVKSWGKQWLKRCWACPWQEHTRKLTRNSKVTFFTFIKAWKINDMRIQVFRAVNTVIWNRTWAYRVQESHFLQFPQFRCRRHSVYEWEPCFFDYWTSRPECGFQQLYKWVTSWVWVSTSSQLLADIIISADMLRLHTVCV